MLSPLPCRFIALSGSRSFPLSSRPSWPRDLYPLPQSANLADTPFFQAYATAQTPDLILLGGKHHPSPRRPETAPHVFSLPGASHQLVEKNVIVRVGQHPRTTPVFPANPAPPWFRCSFSLPFPWSLDASPIRWRFHCAKPAKRGEVFVWYEGCANFVSNEGLAPLPGRFVQIFVRQMPP